MINKVKNKKIKKSKRWYLFIWSEKFYRNSAFYKRTKKIKIIIVRGNKKNQQNPIRKSYRKRGRVLRESTMRNLNKKVIKIGIGITKKDPIKEKAKIIPYSPKKRRTNPTLPISILNPLISSLSPSAKSKGARLVSDKINRNQIIKLKKQKNLKTEMLKVFLKRRRLKRKMERQISYLIAWEEIRTEPI